MVAAAVLPLAVAAILAIEKVREGERVTALEALHVTVRATALVVDREIQHSMGGLDMLARSDNLRRGDLAALYEEAAGMNLPDRWTIVFDRTGQQVINTQTPFGAPLPVATRAAAERVAQVLNGRKPLVTDIMQGPASGKLVTTLFVPGQGANDQYAVAHAYSVGHWTRVSLRPESRPEWLVAVIDRSGRFVMRSQRATELTGQAARPELVAAAAAATNGIVRHRTLEDVDVYDAFSKSELTGWTIAIAAPVESIEASAQAAVTHLVVGTLIALLAAAAIAFVLGRHLIDAVLRASHAARRLGEGEPVVLPTDSVQEFDLLNSALAHASGILSDDRQSRNAAEAERERLLDNERLAKQAAEDDNRRKDEFIAMLGHELRSPLSAISSAGHLLRVRGDNPADRIRFVEVIERQNNHLRHIVDDLLDVSRLIAGKIRLELQPIGLHLCATACVQAIRNTSQASGYDIALDAEPVWILGDQVRLDQIISNLISNALKYSPEGSHISVRVAKRDGRALLSVQDDGMGLDAALIERMFEPFVQGPALPDRSDAGLGIGLSLVKQLVNLHGGDVSAASEGMGRGSRFDIVLPLAAVPEPASPEAASGSLASDSLRILLVEDNSDARNTMAELLAMEGHDVTAAEDGAAALAAMQGNDFAIAVLDIGLPDMSGYELAARIQQHRPGLPLVALTGFGQEQDKDAAANSGFVAHLIKPVAMGDLLQAIRRFAAR